MAPCSLPQGVRLYCRRRPPKSRSQANEKSWKGKKTTAAGIENVRRTGKVRVRPSAIFIVEYYYCCHDTENKTNFSGPGAITFGSQLLFVCPRFLMGNFPRRLSSTTRRNLLRADDPYLRETRVLSTNPTGRRPSESGRPCSSVAPPTKIYIFRRYFAQIYDAPLHVYFFRRALRHSAITAATSLIRNCTTRRWTLWFSHYSTVFVPSKDCDIVA